MVKADQLYQLDLRLREVKMEPDKLFGGVALFFFGDIMQLKPVQAKYIWCLPYSREYHQAFHSQSYWELFTVVSLVENHRQQKDADYANILNRIRVADKGSLTEEDLTALQESVRPEGHPDLRGALVIGSTHAVVNKHNALCLKDLPGQLVTIEAVNSHINIPNYKPKILPKFKNKGVVHDTALLQTLQVKVGSRVMLTDNLDVRDGLSNGSIGTLEAMRGSLGEAHVMMVRFDNRDSGREMQRLHPELAKIHPGCTPIKKQLQKYSTSRSKGVTSKGATVQQFPLILSFASTTHKIQGQTIESPRTCAVDLRSVFGPGQAYVMLGRIQSQQQLRIIGCLPEEKIYCDNEAKSQLTSMKAKSLNNNPLVWEKSFIKSLKVCSLNVSSLRDKIEDIQSDPILQFSDIIILSETWLDVEADEDHPSLQIEGFKLHLNSVGKGKGLAVYYKDKNVAIGQTDNDANLQITIMESHECCVMGLYRSNADTRLPNSLRTMIPKVGPFMVTGDFNICLAKYPDHEVFKTLRTMGFRLQGSGQGLTSEATFFKGSHIDQAWLREGDMDTTVQLYSPYYTCRDHDALLISMVDRRTG
jgi:hypothetical protein